MQSSLVVQVCTGPAQRALGSLGGSGCGCQGPEPMPAHGDAFPGLVPSMRLCTTALSPTPASSGFFSKSRSLGRGCQWREARQQVHLVKRCLNLPPPPQDAWGHPHPSLTCCLIPFISLSRGSSVGLTEAARPGLWCQPPWHGLCQRDVLWLSLSLHGSVN